MFHAPMGRFQLELIYYFTHFSTVVNTTFSTGLVGVEETLEKCCIKNESPTGKKHTNVGWYDGGKIVKVINSN